MVGDLERLVGKRLHHEHGQGLAGWAAASGQDAGR